ncbi:UNVERIFIED_CONTAM: hypothetical protein RMT77_015741 [Armadillidium vulgare]
MVYITSDGKVSNNRQWGFSSISDFFWGILNFIFLFFQTLINPDLNRRGSNYESSSYRPGPGGRGPPPPPPRRRMGRLFGGDGGPPPPPMAGGG